MRRERCEWFRSGVVNLREMPGHSVSRGSSTDPHPGNQRYMLRYYDSMQSYSSLMPMRGTDLEAIEICVKDVSTLDVSFQSHCQLLIGLISDVHHGGEVY